MLDSHLSNLYAKEPEKTRKRMKMKDPAILPDLKKRLKERDEQRKFLPPGPYFSPEEIQEMRDDLQNRPPPKKTGLDWGGNPPPGYISKQKAATHPATPKYPLLLKINEATLAAVGMELRKGDDGKMRTCFIGSDSSS